MGFDNYKHANGQDKSYLENSKLQNENANIPCWLKAAKSRHNENDSSFTEFYTGIYTFHTSMYF
jgi:hypothetical protein